MPIIGLTDRGLAFPEIGQIRKGAKKTAKRPGKDLQWFRVEFDEKEQETAEIFLRKYGEQPDEINIILPFDEIERCWDAWLEAYTAGRMVARSDGEKFTYLVDTETGEIKVKNGQPEIAYTEDMAVGHDYQNKPVHCRPVGRLKVIIPELARAAYMTVMTTSKHDIANLSGQLEAFKLFNNGVIKGIPLVLRRRPKMISVPKKDGQSVRMEKWMLSIEADPTWVKAKLTEVKHLALPSNGFPLLPGDNNREIEAEFVEDSEEWDPLTGPAYDFEVEGEDTPPIDNAKMSLETAQAVTNRGGLKYGDIETEKLSHMHNSLQKIIANGDPDSSIEDLEEKQYKMDAIQVILADRE